jgi:hypothetical protein
MTLTVTALDDSNCQTYAERVTEPYRFGTAIGSFGGQVLEDCVIPTGPATLDISFDNRTGHVVRFAGSVISLVDAAGNSYQLLTKDQMLAQVQSGAWLPNRSWPRPGFAEGYIGTDERTLLADAVRKAQGLPYLDLSAQILPDTRLAVFATFDVPRAVLGNTAQLKFVIYDLVTSTDDAGNATRRSRFEFPFTVSTRREQLQEHLGSVPGSK